MDVPQRKKIVVANWKMHKTIAETIIFVEALQSLVQQDSSSMWIAPPYTSLNAAAESAKLTKIAIGAQNVSEHEKGAFTGEISASMLVEAGAQFVILGHSERRHLYGESSALVNRKAHAAIAHGLKVIICVGESHEQWQSGMMREVVERQISESLYGLSKHQLEHVLIAYEPVWAIGTGISATLEQIALAHALCKDVSFQLSHGGVPIPVLYGGSVNANNATAMLMTPNVDGLLIGSASLDAESFAKIAATLV